MIYGKEYKKISTLEWKIESILTPHEEISKLNHISQHSFTLSQFPIWVYFFVQIKLFSLYLIY